MICKESFRGTFLELWSIMEVWNTFTLQAKIKECFCYCKRVVKVYWREMSQNVLHVTVLKVSEAAIQRCSYKKVLWKYAQIYKRAPMPKSDFNKVALLLYWNCTLAWMFSCKFAAYIQFHFTNCLFNANDSCLKNLPLIFYRLLLASTNMCHFLI